MEGNGNIQNKPSNAAKSVGVSLNVHLAVPPTTTAAQDGSHTPNTPEILNSIVNMQADSLVNMQAAREARETAVAGPFAAEFANQCAIKSYPAPAVVSIPSIVHQETPTTLSSFISGNIYLEVNFYAKLFLNFE